MMRMVLIWGMQRMWKARDMLPMLYVAMLHVAYAVCWNVAYAACCHVASVAIGVLP